MDEAGTEPCARDSGKGENGGRPCGKDPRPRGSTRHAALGLRSPRTADWRPVSARASPASAHTPPLLLRAWAPSRDVACPFGTEAGDYLCVPDMHALVEGAAGQVLAVGAEGDAVDGLLVLGERVDAHAAFHVPEPHRGVEGGAAGVGRGVTTETLRSLPSPGRLSTRRPCSLSQL